MLFNTEKVDETMHLITRDGSVVAGTILRTGDRWNVQILWMGPTGDIEYAAPSMAAAEAFIAGVGMAIEAFGSLP